MSEMRIFQKIAVFLTAAVLGAALPICTVQAAEETAMMPRYTLNAVQEAALARFCASEAAGEPYVCRLCVAAALLNRLSDGRYPSTVSGVLADAGTVAVPVKQADYESALSAVRAAALGIDPTGGATEWARTGMAASARFQPMFAAGTMVFGR